MLKAIPIELTLKTKNILEKMPDRQNAHKIWLKE